MATPIASIVVDPTLQAEFERAINDEPLTMERLLLEHGNRIDASANDNAAILRATHSLRPSRMISLLLRDARVVARGIPYAAYRNLVMFNRGDELHSILPYYESSMETLGWESMYGHSYPDLVRHAVFVANNAWLQSLRVLIDDIPLVFGADAARENARWIANNLNQHTLTLEQVEVLLSNRLMFDALSARQHADIERRFHLTARRAALQEGLHRTPGFGTQNGPLDIILAYMSPGTRSAGALQPLPTSNHHTNTLKRKRNDDGKH